MRINGLLLSAAVVILTVGASGAAHANDDSAEEIIEEFCESVDDDAEDAESKLDEAADDLNDCRQNFRQCRDGGLFQDDPVVECLSDGLSCAARANEDAVEACSQFRENFSEAYNQALRQGRFEDVEDVIQGFFGTRSRARNQCLRPAFGVARLCADTE